MKETFGYHICQKRVLSVLVKSDAENLIVQQHLMALIRTGLCFVFSGLKQNIKSLFLVS